MLTTLAQSISLDHWTPLTVVLAVVVILYALCQGAVMIIRALRGDKQKTGFEMQFDNLLARMTHNEQQAANMAKDFIPPDAIKDVLRGQVVDVLADLRKAQPQPQPQPSRPAATSATAKSNPTSADAHGTETHATVTVESVAK